MVDTPRISGPPEGFVDTCPRCQADTHRCPGCAAPARHGEGACDDCLADLRRQQFRVIRGGRA